MIMKKELLYPFDANYILAKKKRIKRELLAEGERFVDKKIAILGGSTTNDIKLILELFLLNQGIRPSFYESEYNKYYEDAVFDNAELEAFAPDLIYIHTSNRNITCYPQMSDSKSQITDLLEEEYQKYCTIWESIADRYHCPIIQNNFEMPMYRLMGNRDASDRHGKVNFLTRLNMLFYDYADNHEDFYICDINYISADYGLAEWSDPFFYHMYKYALNVNAIPYLAFNVAHIIKSVFGKNKKGLVLDLDNTLWGGVIGDDGVENIALGQEVAEGQIYSEFQNYVKEQTQLGVILNIDSKNDFENAKAGIEHPDSAFCMQDFIEVKANWEPKDQNFREIAEDLNLLPESLVFVDDNPAERSIVAQNLDGVCAPEIGDARDYIRILDRNGFFETTILSEDDQKRNEMYRANADRKKSLHAFTDYHAYLESLQMKGTILPFDEMSLNRVAQLSNKSNQFNLTTKRYTRDEMEMRAKDENYITLYGKLEDKFGDNGIVSVVIGKRVKEECHIELWIMSCRVLKRDMEYAMLDTLIETCQNKGIKKIRGFYYPTAKNAMVKDFYGKMGFSQVACDAAGNSEWELEITLVWEKKNNVICVNGE